MRLHVYTESWELISPFEITNHIWRQVDCVMVELTAGGYTGRAEAQGVYYLDETPETMISQIEAVRAEIEAGISFNDLQVLLPAGGARNAVDCALWDLHCKQQQQTIWQLTGIQPGAVETVFTVGLEETPEAMGDKARNAPANIIKVKLSADRPVECLQAVMSARPDARLVVDANQAWDITVLQQMIDHFTGTNLEMIEQPLPRGQDDDLCGFHSPITLAGDESCLHSSEVDAASQRYQMINIKLDKTGGLSEALKTAEKAKSLGLKLMVGNMCGTSLGMAPAFVIAQLCDFVDIDGPLLNRTDRQHALNYNQGIVTGLTPDLWG